MSNHIKTPVHLHPLSADEPLSTSGRRNRGRAQESDSVKPPNNYFALKAQLEQDGSNDKASWDGSVRGYSKSSKRQSLDASSVGQKSATSLAALWDKPSAPFFMVGSADDDVDDENEAPESFNEATSSLVTNQILNAKWHEYPDSAIHSSIADINQNSTTNNPYHTTIRVLSSAVSKLVEVRRDLERAKRELEEKEASRKRRTEALVNELSPSERDIARRIIQSIFTDDDEVGHRVQRKASSVSLKDTLSEAMEDDHHFNGNEALTPLAGSPALPFNEVPPANEEPTMAHLLQSGTSTPGPQPDAEVPTVVPSRASKADRPNIGDWMGTWWAKGRPRGDLKPKDAVTTAERPHTRRKSAKSVFGTIGISILNPSVAPSNGKKSKQPERPPPAPVPDVVSDAASEVESKASLGSVLSSPIHNTFPALPAAPQLTTMLEDPMLSSTSTPSDPDPVPLIQGYSLRAIVNATRVMTSDPASILADQGRETGPLIARLAYELVRNTRDEGIVFKDKPKDKKDKTKEKADSSDGTNPVATMSSVQGADIASTLSKALGAQPESSRRVKSRNASLLPVSPPFASPLFGAFIPQTSRKPPVAGNAQAPSNTTATNATQNAANVAPVANNKKSSSVPLESIIPAMSKPPTQYLSREYTSLTSRDFHFSIPLPHSASRFSIYQQEHSQTPLTDRYGFMYDVSQYDLLLLIRAKECQKRRARVSNRSEDS
ncbi:hypothetical protein ONZ45_g19555 [Pleurotus djamor]|nr:hypothetical protein ONZ45_g19555 [Pleurotus djamor]